MSTTTDVRAEAPQPMTALSIAQRRRLARVALLDHMARRMVDPRDLIADPPEYLESMLVFDFLLRVPGVARSGLRRINLRAVRDQVNLAVSLGELSAGRRAWLVKALPTCGTFRRPQG